jgi:hypothetical protein
MLGDDPHHGDRTGAISENQAAGVSEPRDDLPDPFVLQQVLSGDRSWERHGNDVGIEAAGR